ncbi:MAG: hypothetical protein OXH68_14350 [Gammaproteobacteria bacterium]|nr:hypothetical protein [Gammaproteobacteria bacterium]
MNKTEVYSWRLRPDLKYTIDHDDFETYRIGHRGRFRIEPARG